MLACRSEKPRIRSGSRASIFSYLAWMNADTRGLLPRLRWPHGVARHADDAVALAEEVQRLGRLLGQADDAGGVAIIICYGSDSRSDPECQFSDDADRATRRARA